MADSPEDAETTDELVSDEAVSDDDVRDALPEDLQPALAGPYLFPNNSRRRIPAVLYALIGLGCIVLRVVAGGDAVLVNNGILVAGVFPSGGIIPGIPPKKNAARPAGEWNRFRIVCRGKDLTVELNGEVVNALRLTHERIADRPASGSIGFQDHALPLQLRNIRIRRL